MSVRRKAPSAPNSSVRSIERQALLHRVVPGGVGVRDESASVQRVSGTPAPDASGCTSIGSHEVQRRMKDVQRELATRPQMGMRTSQGRQLIVTREIVKECAKRNDDKRVSIAERERAHVSLMHGDACLDVGRQRRRFLAEFVEHTCVKIESRDANAVFCDGNRDAAGPRAQLEHRSAGIDRLAAIPLDIPLKAAGMHYVVNVGVVVCDAGDSNAGLTATASRKSCCDRSSATGYALRTRESFHLGSCAAASCPSPVRETSQTLRLERPIGFMQHGSTEVDVIFRPDVTIRDFAPKLVGQAHTPLKVAIRRAPRLRPRVP